MDAVKEQLAEALKKAINIAFDRAAGGRMQTSRSYAEEVYQESKAALAAYSVEKEKQRDTA